MTSPLYEIEVETGVTTHEDILSGINANFGFSEGRLSGLESDTLQHSGNWGGGVLEVNCDYGHNIKLTLTQDLSLLEFVNQKTGDSGLILIEQDNTGGRTFSTSQTVLAGDLADIASITPSGSGHGAIGWYYDGSEEFLFVSDVT